MTEIPNRRENDAQIAVLTVEVAALKEAVNVLVAKVDDLTAVKNKGLGILIAVGGFGSLIGAVAGDFFKH